MADMNFISHCGQRPVGVVEYGVLMPLGSGYADTLKITDCADGQVTADAIHGGSEDCLDVNNRCQRISVRVKEWHSGGKYVATIKGASEDITLEGCIIVPGKETDIDIGNHSDQQSGRTVRVRLRMTRADGRPVRVRVLHGHVPEILNPKAPYEISTWAKGWFSTVWDKIKRLAALLSLRV